MDELGIWDCVCRVWDLSAATSWGSRGSSSGSGPAPGQAPVAGAAGWAGGCGWEQEAREAQLPAQERARSPCSQKFSTVGSPCH